MVSVTNKIWETVSPIVLFWTITGEITKLKDFLRLITGLDIHQKLEVIWRMTRPEDPLLINAPEIHTVYECINLSPQLTLIQTEMRSDHNTFLRRDEYAPIKRKIAYFLQNTEWYAHEGVMMRLITQLLQLSSPECVEEMLWHYYNIWTIWIHWENHSFRCRRYTVVIPITISAEEQHILRLEINDSDNQEMLSMHDALENMIVKCRYDDITRLECNIEQQLTDLHQTLKNHLL